MAKFNEARKIQQAIREFKALIPDLVTVMGTDATNHYKENFVKGGFDNETVEKWKPRKRPDRKRPGRAILVDKGHLRRSLRFKRRGKMAVEMHSNVPYAQRHNEGLKGMPKRQIVGFSGKLNRNLKEKFDRRIKGIFR